VAAQHYLISRDHHFEDVVCDLPPLNGTTMAIGIISSQ
jgi:hypothetical protein